MENFKKKFRLIFIPYLIVLAASMVGYSFVNWWFFLRKESITVQEDVMLFLVPIFVAIVAVVIGLRPRIRLLTDTVGKNEYVRLTINIMAIGSIAFPLVLSQYLLPSVTGRLTRVSSPSEIGKVDYSKYYSITQFTALKQYAQIERSEEMSGRTRKPYYKVYIAMPLVDNAVLKTIPGLTDSTSMNNRLFPSAIIPKTWLCIAIGSDRKKEDDSTWIHIGAHTYFERYLLEFEALDFSRVTYMERLAINDTSREYRHLIGRNYDLRDTKRLTILEAHFNPFEERHGSMLAYTIGGILLAAFVFWNIIAFTGWDEDQLEEFEEKRRTIH